MLVEHVYRNQSRAWDCGVMLLAVKRVHEKDLWVAYLSDADWSIDKKWKGIDWIKK